MRIFFVSLVGCCCLLLLPSSRSAVGGILGDLESLIDKSVIDAGKDINKSVNEVGLVIKEPAWFAISEYDLEENSTVDTSNVIGTILGVTLDDDRLSYIGEQGVVIRPRKHCDEGVSVHRRDVAFNKAGLVINILLRIEEEKCVTRRVPEVKSGFKITSRNVTTIIERISREELYSVTFPLLFKLGGDDLLTLATGNPQVAALSENVPRYKQAVLESIPFLLNKEELTSSFVRAIPKLSREILTEMVRLFGDISPSTIVPSNEGANAETVMVFVNQRQR